MRLVNLKNKKAQAASEMAIFGTIILVVFSALLSYSQRMNEEQYLNMEVFRRALHKANKKNASVSFTLMQYRRFTDVFSGFYQGNRNMLGASANVFWAIPQVGKPLDSMTIFRLNEDEKDWTKLLHLDNTDKSDDLQIGKITSHGETDFTDNADRSEDNANIVNRRTSSLEDAIVTNVGIVDPGKDKDSEKDDTVVGNKKFVQYLYRDAAGQYKYGSKELVEEKKLNTKILRDRSWTTPF